MPIYDSPPSQPDDDFWLDQGKKMVEGSRAAVRDAAGSLLTGLGAMQGIYIGILGFAKFIPEDMPLWKKFMFILPMGLWLWAIWLLLGVLMTREIHLYLHSPDDIQSKEETLLLDRQKRLRWVLGLMTVGLILAFLLLGWRLFQ
jgi:hypothetical protein